MVENSINSLLYAFSSHLVTNEHNHFNQQNLKIVACCNEPAAVGVKFHRAKLRPALDMKIEQVGVDESMKLFFWFLVKID